MTDDTRRLIDYRLEQAAETLEVARELSGAGHLRDAANRAYYAMFYGGLALLASRALGASKHSGVLSLFNRHFVKTGEFPREYGRLPDFKLPCNHRRTQMNTDSHGFPMVNRNW